MMRRITIGFLAAILAGGAIALVLEREAQARLRTEIAVLRRANSASNQLQQDNQLLTAAQVTPEELQRLCDNQANLENMRSTLAAAQRQLRVQAQAQTVNDPPKPLAAGMTSVANLPDAGQATPEAAAQSFFRAVAQIDPDALADQLEFDDDGRKKANALFNSYDEATRRRIGSPERMMAIFFAEYYGRVTGMQTPDYLQSPTPGWGYLRMKLQTSSGRLHDAYFLVHQSASGWHEVVQGYWIDNWSQYLK